jgi:hypothetical protein
MKKKIKKEKVSTTSPAERSVKASKDDPQLNFRINKALVQKFLDAPPTKRQKKAK